MNEIRGEEKKIVRKTGPTATPAKFLWYVCQIAKRFSNLRNRISKIEEDADALEFDIAELLKLLKALAGSDLTKLIVTEQKSDKAKAMLMKMAESGVSSLNVNPGFDDTATVSIDGGKSFKLTPVLADLLNVLAQDTGHSDDSLVAWKPLQDVAKILRKNKKKKRDVTKHSVIQQIHRLKEKFQQEGANPYWIQTNRHKGARFALQRHPMPVIKGDPS